MTFNGKRLKVLKAHPDATANVAAPGASGSAGDLLGWSAQGPVIATQPGAIVLTMVVPEGRPPMSGAEFARRSGARS
jgi:methionyl-tRNA formyltransferase